MELREKYPWHRTRAGESFFVPALDLMQTRQEGLAQALAVFGSRVRVSSQQGVYKGMLGVMFKRRTA